MLADNFTALYLSIRLQRLLQCIQIGQIDHVDFNTMAWSDFREQAIRATVNIVATNQVIAAIQQLRENCDGAQARREGWCINSIVQGGQAAF